MLWSRSMNIARQRDQFYTQKNVAQACVKALSGLLPENAFFIEPSAGEGAFLYALEEQNYSYLAYDIEPKHLAIIHKDFLYTKAKDFPTRPLILIGNPPFGKNSSLAIRFFNHAAQFCEMIALILPATFEKDSIQNRLALNMELIKSEKLMDDRFLFNGELVSVPTVFQIWKKTTNLRTKNIKPTTSLEFEFVTKDKADFAIQRVGNAAGKVKTDFNHVATASHYFLKANDVVRKKFETIDWSTVKYNTAGNPSISKTELIAMYEKK